MQINWNFVNESTPIHLGPLKTKAYTINGARTVYIWGIRHFVKLGKFGDLYGLLNSALRIDTFLFLFSDSWWQKNTIPPWPSFYTSLNKEVLWPSVDLNNKMSLFWTHIRQRWFRFKIMPSLIHSRFCWVSISFQWAIQFWQHVLIVIRLTHCIKNYSLS